MTLGEFVAFYLYLTLLMAPFRSLGLLVGQAQRAIAGGTRIFQVLDTQPDIVEPPRAMALPAGDGHLRMEGVTFAYGPDEAPVLHDIDLDVPAGRTIALIGPDRLRQDQPHPVGAALRRTRGGPRAARRRRRA